MFEHALGETADSIRDTTRRFATDRIAPISAQIDDTNTFPRHLWPEMGGLGLHGITVEEEYGGSGLGYLEHVVAMEEISRASASVVRRQNIWHNSRRKLAECGPRPGG